MRSRLHSHSDPLHLAHADVIVAPVIEARGFGVRVSGHALRDLDAPAIREVVRYAVARKVWQPIAVSIPASEARRRTMYQTSVRDIAPGPSFFVLPIAARNSGPFRFSATPAALM